MPPTQQNASEKSRPQHILRRQGIFARCGMLLLLLVLSAALVYGILTILKSPKIAKQPDPKPKQIKPTQQTDPAESSPATKNTQAPSTTSAQEPDPISLGNEATKVLEKFLAAQTLEERKNLIECIKPDLDLSNTCLAGPLPQVRMITPEFRESNPVEQLIEFFHQVDFGAVGTRSDPCLILVRTHGKGPPKVVVDPFLDLYGGRLAAYVSTPSDKAGFFHVVVYPLSTCTDDTIPDHKKKMTLKLMAAPNGKEIARAYFGRQSKIAEMLEDGTHDLSYGSPKPCTIMLSWNTTDKPDRPYLVASDITSLNWNP